MKTKSFMTFSIIAILFCAVGAISFSTSHSIFAQNGNTPLVTNTTSQNTMAAKGNQNTPLVTNTTSQNTMAAKGNQNTPLVIKYQTPMNMNNQNGIINSSINIIKSMYQGIASKFNVTLDQAINTSEKTIGNKSHALEATTGIRGGYITYSIILGTPDMKFYNVIVDPGNGKVLSSNQLSILSGIMMLHGGHGMMGGWNGQDNNMMPMNQGWNGQDNNMMPMNHGW
jgi:hypothetical protein